MARFDREGNRLEPTVMVICPECGLIMKFYDYNNNGDEVYICECGFEEVY